MTALQLARPRQVGGIAAAGAAMARLAAGLLRMAVDRTAARGAARHLSSLSDTQLKDIGVARGQIEHLVRGLTVPGRGHGHAGR